MGHQVWCQSSLRKGMFICKCHLSHQHIIHDGHPLRVLWIHEWSHTMISSINFLTCVFNEQDKYGVNGTVLRNAATLIVLCVLHVGDCWQQPQVQALIIASTLLLILYVHLSYLLPHLSLHLPTKHFGRNLRNICCPSPRTN